MFKNKARIGILLSWAAVLLWMLLIFYFSSQAAEQSDKLSGGIAEIIGRFLAHIIPGYGFDLVLFDRILRKAAHFSIYLVLGVLVSDALKRSGIKGRKLIAFALGICILYAASDEFHQLFVSGRGGQATDVLLDSAGAMLGIGGRMLLKMNRYKKGK